jgi:hypothetical protein
VKNTADVTGGKPIAVLLQSISGVSAINPLVAFYDIHGGKRKALFFYFVPDTTRDKSVYHKHISVSTTGVQTFLMDRNTRKKGNDCKCSRDRQLYVPSARRNLRFKYLVMYSMAGLCGRYFSQSHV